jgi:tetratricopeptide (TPR) repeat protein
LLAALPHQGAEDPAIGNARLHPDDFTANHRAGEYFISRKDFRAAIPYLEKAWKLDPANYPNGYDLALVYFDTGAPQKSRALIDALLRQKDRAELHDLLGDVEESAGHINEAAHQYETAARMDPSEKNLFDLGSDLLKHGGIAPALKVFAFGVERYPSSAKLRVGLGIAYYSVGQYSEAVETLSKAVDLDPKDPKPLGFLGKMYDISPRYADEVTKHLARFVALYPDNSAANYYYALSLRKRSLGGDLRARQKMTESHLVKAVKLKPDFADAHYELGLLYEDEGRDLEATRQYEMAVKYAPNLAKAHYRLARLYKKSGHELLAQKEFQTLKALNENR